MIKKFKISGLIPALFFVLSVLSQASGQMVAKSEYGTFLLKGGTIHTVTHGTMAGDILIKDGKIEKIGKISDRSTKTIDCTGLHIYPGMIDGGTHLGLKEIGSISLTQDYRELGDFIPHMQALTAINPNSVNIPVTRTNGVTTVIAQTSGGLFPGTAALIHLHGYTPHQMYAGFKAVQLNFPSGSRRGRWDKRSQDDIKKEEEKALKKLNEIWDKAVLYAHIDSLAKTKNKKLEDYNPQMDALLPVLHREMPLMIEVNKQKDILSALKWIKQKNIKAILTGVAEGYRCAKKIAKAGIPVITGPVLSIPRRDYERYDVAYKNAGVMQKAGVKVIIRTNETENVRNLPFNAGFAAAYGMGKEEALKAVTIVPAEVFGLADKIGSIDEGKMANIFVSDGDPFEPKTQILHLFINGYKVPIENRQILLYKEFLDRNP